MTSRAITGEDVQYSGELGPIDAYLSRPSDGKKYPGVVVIHEIWGLNKHIREVTDRLASEGYVALAPHLFSSKHVSPLLTEENITNVMEFFSALPPGKQRDQEYTRKELEKLPEERRRIVGQLMGTLFDLPQDKLTNELVAGTRYLRSGGLTDGRIGSVGFCFGGSMSGRLACTGETDASIIFYGANPEPIDTVRNIKGSVLGIYGGSDKRINAGLPELVKSMVDNEKDFEMCIYPGAPHAFFNDTHKSNYREEAARDAWERVLRFFSVKLKKQS